MGGNVLLTVAALIILGSFVLSVNRWIVNNQSINYESKYVISAISYAQSIIDEAKSKDFDEARHAGGISNLTSLTSPDLLGPESGENIISADTGNGSSYLSMQQFDDVDDYNGYTRLINTEGSEPMQLRATVQYVSYTYPDSSLAVRSWAKKMTVSVTSQFISIPLSISYTFCY